MESKKSDKKPSNQSRSPYQTRLKGDVKMDMELPTRPVEYKKYTKKKN